jgi:hypothetical protein
VNASIRLLFAVTALLLSACAGTAARESASAPRTYRETLVVEQTTPRSGEQSLTSLQRSHERMRSSRDRAGVTMGR